jgi:hypothetical protein
MSIENVTDGVIDLIKKNIIAKTDVISDISIGDTTISVYNSYRFHAGEEIVIIDFGYNQPGHVHYNSFEYARIKTVNNTNSITLYSSVQSNWEIAQKSFIQKTIGHSPLYEDNVLYGDREVIPVDDMAITVEPVSLGNEWIYLQGGLSQEYKLRIMVYGKSISSDEGRRILDRYSDAVYSLLNSNIHLDVNDYDVPILTDYSSGTNTIVIEDTPENQENFVVFSPPYPFSYVLQDNLGASCWFKFTDRVIGGGLITLTMDRSFGSDFLLDEFAVVRRFGTYVYDSRADQVVFGQVSKGSAFLRAAEISWFGKIVKEHVFPQTSDGVDDFSKI